MTEKILYTCKYNLRPRINGMAVLILAGEPFSKDAIDSHTFETFLKSGEINMYEQEVQDVQVLSEETVTETASGTIEDAEVPAEESEEKADAKPASEADELEEIKAEALEKYGVELKSRKVSTARKALKDLEKKAQSKPVGIFCLKVEDLVDKGLDELDAIHANICAEHDLTAPEPFKSVEEAVEKLSSEA